MNDCFCSFFLMALITTCFFLLRLKLKWLKNGGAKVFIAAYGFLRIITFLAGDHNINKFLIILKTYAHYLRHIFINQKQNIKTEVHLLTKMKNTDC